MLSISLIKHIINEKMGYINLYPIGKKKKYYELPVNSY